MLAALKPGGMLYVRDYAQGDFKETCYDHDQLVASVPVPAQAEEPALVYARANGTTSRFLSLDELKVRCI